MLEDIQNFRATTIPGRVDRSQGILEVLAPARVLCRAVFRGESPRPH